MGTIIPTPSIQVKSEIKSTKKIFLRVVDSVVIYGKVMDFSAEHVRVQKSAQL